MIVKLDPAYVLHHKKSVSGYVFDTHNVPIPVFFSGLLLLKSANYRGNALDTLRYLSLSAVFPEVNSPRNTRLFEILLSPNIDSTPLWCDALFTNGVITRLTAAETIPGIDTHNTSIVLNVSKYLLRSPLLFQ